MSNNSFEILGLHPKASADMVRDQYRRLSLVHHPDRGGDPEMFNTLHKAYKDALAIAQQPRICTACRGTGRATQSIGFNTVYINCRFCSGLGRET